MVVEGTWPALTSPYSSKLVYWVVYLHLHLDRESAFQTWKSQMTPQLPPPESHPSDLSNSVNTPPPTQRLQQTVGCRPWFLSLPLASKIQCLLSAVCSASRMCLCSVPLSPPPLLKLSVSPSREELLQPPFPAPPQSTWSQRGFCSMRCKPEQVCILRIKDKLFKILYDLAANFFSSLG